MEEEKPRDARRRRIVQGGADRLAFITGQISSLPSAANPPPAPPPTPTVPTPSTTTKATPKEASAPPQWLLSQTELETVETRLHPSISSPQHEHEESPARSQDEEITPERDDTETAACASGSLSEEVKRENISRPLTSNDKSRSVVPPVQRAVVHSSTVPHSKMPTSKQILSAISDTENIRSVCALTISLLVIISHNYGASVIAGVIRRLLPFPIYMILLTDATIVLARAIAEQTRTLANNAKSHVGGEELGWADQLEKTLGTGWVVYKAMTGLFMDCSIYAVLVIAGLSLAS